MGVFPNPVPYWGGGAVWEALRVLLAFFVFRIRLGQEVTARREKCSKKPDAVRDGNQSGSFPRIRTRGGGIYFAGKFLPRTAS